jgi:type IV secretion system protein VirB4
MQLLPALTRDPAVSRREASVGKFLPYARHVNEHTIETRDGMLMQFVRLRGFLFETADTDELNYRKQLRDTMLQAVGSPRFAVYHHLVRRRVEPSLAGEYPDDFSRALNNAWEAPPLAPQSVR